MRLSDSEKQQYAQWAAQVLADGYLARHEFQTIGYLPPKVLRDSDVLKIGVTGNHIEISDYLLRHGSREKKIDRGAALDSSVLACLPEKLEGAAWYFDSRHNNVTAAFSIGMAGKLGKAVVQFNYTRRKEVRNAVVTTGVVSGFNLSDGHMRQIV